MHDLQLVRRLSMIFHAGHAAFSASRTGQVRYAARQSRITNDVDQRLYALFVQMSKPCGMNASEFGSCSNQPLQFHKHKQIFLYGDSVITK
jgi:hypothetical protein